MKYLLLLLTILSAGCTEDVPVVCDGTTLFCPWDPWEVWECDDGQWSRVYAPDAPCVNGAYRPDLRLYAPCTGEVEVIAGCRHFYCHPDGSIRAYEENNNCYPYPADMLP
jgi:hypothetical protein